MKWINTISWHYAIILIIFKTWLKAPDGVVLTRKNSVIFIKLFKNKVSLCLSLHLKYQKTNIQFVTKRWILILKQTKQKSSKAIFCFCKYTKNNFHRCSGYIIWYIIWVKIFVLCCNQCDFFKRFLFFFSPKRFFLI